MERYFIGALTRHGNKDRARRIFFNVMARLADKYSNMSFNELLEFIIETVSPVLTFVSKKRGGTSYNYPKRISFDRSKSTAARWIVRASRSRSELNIEDKLFNEFVDVFSGKGKALAKRLEFHKRAISNRFVLKSESRKVKPYFLVNKNINKYKTS
jgi:small subunit ribosomal protein S7